VEAFKWVMANKYWVHCLRVNEFDQHIREWRKSDSYQLIF
jgi:hypothetical protein